MHNFIIYRTLLLQYTEDVDIVFSMSETKAESANSLPNYSESNTSVLVVVLFFVDVFVVNHNTCPSLRPPYKQYSILSIFYTAVCSTYNST